MTLFYLVVTFWASLGHGSITSETIPAPYYSAEACAAAGAAAEAGFNGGGNVNWTCVPTDSLFPADKE